MKKKKLLWPSVSVAIATRDSERTLELCLSSVRKQDYSSPLEIIIADGGSCDNTLNIAKKFGARIVPVPESKQNAEYNKGVAVNAAKNDVLLMIDHDNILPHKNWLKKMIKPLIDDSNIFGSGVLQFHYDKKMSLVDRYSALFGGTDPVTIFFNKSAHQSYRYKGFHLKGKLIEDTNSYYKVQLDSKKLPALGGNGSILRRNLISKAKSSPEYFFHIDIHVDLAKQGYTTYAFVKDTIIHLTNNNFIPFLRRRRYFIEKYHFVDKTKRRYSIYESSTDKIALVGFIIYSLSIILPTLDAIRGFVKIHDFAWFLHPLMCLGILFVYGITTIKEGAKNVFLAGKSGVGNRR
ncbi:MAG: glycosyltransferase family 2 protein [Candidatus Daviesbacteria bacterium]|nr:glycosyltransferase family 2 protein [Candidatus Daviesbacteria bacterium]